MGCGGGGYTKGYSFTLAHFDKNLVLMGVSGGSMGFADLLMADANTGGEMEVHDSGPGEPEMKPGKNRGRWRINSVDYQRMWRETNTTYRTWETLRHQTGRSDAGIICIRIRCWRWIRREN
jgi:hypothetical protein